MSQVKFVCSFVKRANVCFFVFARDHSNFLVIEERYDLVSNQV